MSTPSRPIDRALHGALWVALLALVAATSIARIYSNDYWWHLRAGQWIVEQGAIPVIDVFSFSAEGSRWIDIHWLFQVGLYGLHQLFGHPGAAILCFSGALATAALLAAIGYRRDRPAVTVLAVALVLLTSGFRFMPRPELPSFVFLAAELYLFDRYRRKRDVGIFAVAAIQLVWVNVHGLYAVGLAVCAIHTVGEGIDAWRRPAPENRWGRVVDVGGVTVLSVLVAFLNPNGSTAVLYPLIQLAMLGSPGQPSDFSLLVTELLPPFHPRSALNALSLSFPLVLGVGAAVGMAINGFFAHTSREPGVPSRSPRLPLVDLLLWLAFGYLALSAQRNIPLFAIVAAPLFVRHWNEVLDRVERSETSRRTSQRIAAGALVMAIALVVVDIARDRFYERVLTPREAGIGVMESRFPVGAIAWIDEHRPPGPIYHKLAFGGYLLWHLYPDYRSLLDGRLEVFGFERLHYFRALSPEAFLGLEQRFPFGVAILENEGRMPLHAWMLENPSWRLEYVDEVAAVFVRTSPAWRPGTPEVDIDAPDLFPPVSVSRGRVADTELWRKRLNFYAASGRYERALAFLDEVIGVRPDFPGAAQYRASLEGALRRAERSQ